MNFVYLFTRNARLSLFSLAGGVDHTPLKNNEKIFFLKK